MGKTKKYYISILLLVIGCAIIGNRVLAGSDKFSYEDIIRLEKVVNKTLDDIQKNLFNKAKKLLDNSIVDVKSVAELKNAVNNKKIGRAFWCGSPTSEDKIRAATGAKSLNGIPKKGTCFECGKTCEMQFRFGKSY